MLTSAFCFSSALTCQLLSLGAAVFRDFNTLSDLCVDSVHIETVFGEEQLGIAVRDEAVWNTHPHDFDLIQEAILFQQFHDGRAEAARKVCLFDSDYQTLRARERKQ